MSKRLLMLVVLGFTCLVSGWSVTATAADVKPPVAEVIPHIDSVHGYERVDDYYWMRDRENPKVIKYLEDENAYTSSVMQHTEALQEQLFEEFKSRIKETDLDVPVKRDNYYYYTRQEEGKQYDFYCRKKGSLDAEEEIILDMNAMAEGMDFLRLGTYRISDNHNMLAYSTDESGSERYTMRFKNLKTGEIMKDSIPNCSGDAEWAADGKTLFYTVPDDAWRPYRLFRHTLGTDPADDKLIYEETDEKYGIGIGKTKSRQYLILAAGSKTTDEARFLKADNPNGEFQLIEARKPGREYSVAHHGDYFYILTNDHAIDFKLVKAPVASPGFANWVDVVPARHGVKIDDMDVFKDYLVLYEREQGLQTIRVMNLKTDDSYMIDFPEPVYSYGTHGNPEYNTNLVRFTYESMVTPNSVYDYNMDTKKRELKKQREVLGDFDPNDYESERVFATATDGAKIPISMVYRKGMKKDGTNPTYLYGYGSYGASMDPWFSNIRISLLDRGFIFAVAHIRGGGEMGRMWYEDGKFLNKRNTFTDFINSAEFLIDENYTSSEHLAISGGSAGGMLIGAVVNMRPELFKAAVATVPFVDVMNTMLDETIPLTVVEYEEWGDPNDKQFYDYMMSYSPYDNVKPQVYPDMLIQSSLNDTRVQYWEGTKWAAKLRANNLGDNMLLLKTNMGAGHGGSSGRYDSLKEYAFQYTFVLESLGIKN